MPAVDKIVENETINEALSETIQSIDQIATHHSIEEVYIDNVAAFKIDAHYIWYRARGIITAGLQWGSNSDLSNDLGAEGEHEFDFECDIPAPVENPEELETSLIDLRVSDGGWYDNYYDEAP